MRTAALVLPAVLAELDLRGRTYAKAASFPYSCTCGFSCTGLAAFDEHLDPLVLSHAKALLASGPDGSTDYLDADLRDTGTILTAARDTLDLSQPVAVMLIGVLHCIPDDDDPYGIVRRLMAAVVPGSYLVVGHPASDVEVEASAQATAGLNTRLAAPVKFRSREQVAGFLDGMEVLEPGLVQYPQWRPGPGVTNTAPTSAWCAVARKG